jgi:Cdc6-like AAA superfamily ATPase
MNWFSRMFRRNQPDYQDFSDVDDMIMAPAILADTQSSPSVPTFSASASSLDRRGMAPGFGDRGFGYRRAFLPSQPVSDASAFAGRGDLLRRVIRAIEDQHLHVILYGDRGIGKTSVLRVVCELAGKANYVVQYTSCGEDSDFSETFRAMAARIPLLYDSEYDPSVEVVEQGGSMADRLPDGAFSVSQLSDVLASVAGTRVLIVLDEFDRATNPRFRNGIAELIKNLSDRAIRVQLLIAGVADNLTDLIAHVPSIRRNIVGIPVPNMTDDEVGELIAIGEQTGGVSFEKLAVERLVAASAGLPYLAALIGQHATLAAVDAGAAKVVADHVDIACSRAAEDIESRLSPTTQYALSESGAMAPESVVVKAAREAVRRGGLIEDPALRGAIERLAGRQAALFEIVPRHPDGAWRFAEDGASTYIWLRACTGVSAVTPSAIAERVSTVHS